jgi:hypothetical protein
LLSSNAFILVELCKKEKNFWRALEDAEPIFPTDSFRELAETQAVRWEQFWK